MLFNKNLDKMLFTVLKYDKENRKDILDLLHRIPNELYIDIQEYFDKEPTGIFIERIYMNKEKTKRYIAGYHCGVENITIIEQIRTKNDYKEHRSLTLTYFADYMANYTISNEGKTIENSYAIYKMPITNIFTKRVNYEMLPKVKIYVMNPREKNFELEKNSI